MVMETGKANHNNNFVIEKKSGKFQISRSKFNINGREQEIKIRNRTEGAARMYYSIKNIFIDKERSR